MASAETKQLSSFVVCDVDDLQFNYQPLRPLRALAAFTDDATTYLSSTENKDHANLNETRNISCDKHEANLNETRVRADIHIHNTSSLDMIQEDMQWHAELTSE